MKIYKAQGIALALFLLSMTILAKAEEKAIPYKLPAVPGVFDMHVGDTGAICQQVRQACKDSVGNPWCASPTTQQTNLNNLSSLRIQIFFDLHENYTKSQEVLDICCKDNQKCKDRLQSTGFLFEGDSPSASDEFDWLARKIEVSDQFITQCSNLECLEEFYFHELGHACEEAIAYGSSPNEVVLAANGCSHRTRPKLETYTKYIGAPKTACVNKKIKEQLAIDANHCPDQWFDEAMASIIFSDFFHHPLHLQRLCGSTEYDAGHPAMSDFAECMPLGGVSK